jgi:tRNA uridine 5-carboxymethylaminomethyl modification enzyme
MAFATPPTERFDLIVVGGGHAGCEAALTAARLGVTTALFTLNLDRIAWQPCNPAVGGPAKSQLVHEVDALGGVIGRLADATALQKRLLNASRGPAVWALRAQTDKRQYARQMLQLLQHTPNLALREAMVTGLEIEGDPGDPEGGRARVRGSGIDRSWAIHWVAAPCRWTSSLFFLFHLLEAGADGNGEFMGQR